jgi:hypothetical protein
MGDRQRQKDIFQISGPDNDRTALAMVTPNVLDNRRGVIEVKHETLADTEPANTRVNAVQKPRFLVHGTIQFDGLRSQCSN